MSDPAGAGPYGGRPLPRRDAPLYVEELGEGPPVMLLHGFGANSHTWRHWTTPLARRHRLLLVDMKGFGYAPKPVGGEYGPHDLAEAVARYIRQEDLRRLVLVGHSLGGGVALLAADRLRRHGEVERLAGMVLVSAAALPQPLPRFMRLGRIPLLGRIAAHVFPGRLLVRMVLRSIVDDPSRVGREQVDAYSRPLATWEGRRAAIAALVRILPPDVEEMPDRLRALDVPALALWGAQDRVVPPRLGQELAALLPAGEFTLVDHCGHVLPEERPEEGLAEVERFLRRVTEPG